jgi:hypothetical protein
VKAPDPELPYYRNVLLPTMKTKPTKLDSHLGLIIQEEEDEEDFYHHFVSLDLHLSNFPYPQVFLEAFMLSFYILTKDNILYM